MLLFPIKYFVNNIYFLTSPSLALTKASFWASSSLRVYLSVAGLNGLTRKCENLQMCLAPLTSCSIRGSLTMWKSSYRSSIWCGGGWVVVGVGFFGGGLVFWVVVVLGGDNVIENCWCCGWFVVWWW